MQHHIAGEESGRSGETLIVLGYATGEVVEEDLLGDGEDVEAAITLTEPRHGRFRERRIHPVR